MTRRQKLLVAVLVVGGLAVVASYVWGFLSHPETRWDIWGGIPLSLRPVYTVSMLLAAAGFFPMTTFLLLRVDHGDGSMPHWTGYRVLLCAYLLALAGSAVWMPLTYAAIEAPSALLWLAIRITLLIVAIGAVGILAVLLRAPQKTPVRWYRLAVLGCILFCWQTVVLDALVWTYYYPL